MGRLEYVQLAGWSSCPLSRFRYRMLDLRGPGSKAHQCLRRLQLSGVAIPSPLARHPPSRLQLCLAQFIRSLIVAMVVAAAALACAAGRYCDLCSPVPGIGPLRQQPGHFAR